MVLHALLLLHTQTQCTSVSAGANQDASSSKRARSISPEGDANHGQSRNTHPAPKRSKMTDEEKGKLQRETERRKLIEEESRVMVQARLEEVQARLEELLDQRPDPEQHQPAAASQKYAACPEIFEVREAKLYPGHVRNGERLWEAIKPLIKEAEEASNGRRKFTAIKWKILTTNSNTLYHQTVERLIKQDVVRAKSSYESGVGVHSPKCSAASPPSRPITVLRV